MSFLRVHYRFLDDSLLPMHSLLLDNLVEPGLRNEVEAISTIDVVKDDILHHIPVGRSIIITRCSSGHMIFQVQLD